MERRMWLGIGLLVFFLAAGLFAALASDHVCAPIAEALERASDYAAAGQLDTAAELTQQANNKWQSSWNMLAIVADHSPMDEIDGLFAQANMYAKMGAVQDFSATCARLSKLVEAIAEAHSLTWWNLV